MWQNIAKSFQTELNDLGNALSFAPAWAIWATLLVGVFVVACLVHAGVLAFLHRLFRGRRPYLNRVLDATKNPIRLALLLLALAIALPAAPLGPDGKFIFVHCLALGTICLIGWISLKVLHVGANLYLRNFRIDVPDNLLARKHVTQVRVLVRVLDTIVVLLTLGFALMTFDTVRQYGISLFASAGVAGVIFGLAAQPVLSNLIAGFSWR
jgi:small-conductance mechanosensitive channel